VVILVKPMRFCGGTAAFQSRGSADDFSALRHGHGSVA